MSFDYSKLRGKIREKLQTQDRLASLMDISATSLSLKLSNQSQFKQSEIAKMVDLLNINEDEISDYFFKQKVQEAE